MVNRGRIVGAFLVILVGGALLIAVFSALPGGPAMGVENPWVGPWLWEVRGLDLAIQALLILAGVLGVLLILGREEEGS